MVKNLFFKKEPFSMTLEELYEKIDIGENAER